MGKNLVLELMFVHDRGETSKLKAKANRMVLFLSDVKVEFSFSSFGPVDLRLSFSAIFSSTIASRFLPPAIEISPSHLLSQELPFSSVTFLTYMSRSHWVGLFMWPISIYI
jgi:hypothetical protein